MGSLSADQARQLKDQVMNGGTTVATESRDDGNIFSKFMGWKPGKKWSEKSLGSLRRAARLGGLGVGTAAGVVGETVPGIRKWTPDVYSSSPQAFKAFWDQAKQGDWDAAIDAYQEEMGAGKYFWGTSELVAEALAPAGSARVGTKVISSAPKLAGTLGRVLPATRGRGVQEGLELLGEGLRMPWRAEEAVSKAIAYPFRKGWQKFRGAPAAKVAGEAAERVDDITPEQIADAERIMTTERKTPYIPFTTGAKRMDVDVGDIIPRPPDEMLGPMITRGEMEASQAGAMAKGPRIKLAILGNRHKDAEDAIRALEARLLKAQKRLKKPAVIEVPDVSTLSYRRQHPLTPNARNKALNRRLQDQSERNEAEWFIETFDEQMAAAREAERTAAMRLATQQTYARGKFAKEAIAKYSKGEFSDKPLFPTTPSAGAIPDQPPSISPTMPEDVLDPFAKLNPELIPKLGLWSKSVNKISGISEDLFKKIGIRKRTEELEGVIETTQRIRRQILTTAESDASVIGRLIRTGLRKNFTTDAAGNITDEALQNRAWVKYSKEGDKSKPWLVFEGDARLESPTIQDIAARYDRYERYLTQEQKDFMISLREILEEGTEEIIQGRRIIKPGYNRMFRENLPDWDPKQIRPDVKGSGFYIPRGRARLADGTEVFNVSDEFIQKGRKGMIGPEQKARMPAMGKMVDMQGNPIPDLRNYTYDSLEKTVQGYINQVADRITDIKIRGKHGILTGLAEEYTGTTPIRAYPNRQAIIAGVTEADDAFGRAIQREFLSNPWYNKAGIKAVNNWYRGVKANFDLSAIGIHGSLAMFRAPKEWAEATRLSFKALKTELPFPGKVRGSSQEIVDQALMTIDQEAKAGGRLTSRLWANFGLRQGGGTTETMLPGAERLIERGGRGGRLVGGAFQVSNRLFGAFGDVLRLRWADELLRSELAKGKTIKELMESGDLQQIANSANRMTGWSDQRFGGDIGEFAMFAARFFQSRLETLGQAFGGAGRLRLPTGQALETLGQTRVNVPFRGRPMIESDVLTSIGRKMTIEQREALQTMIRLIGIGAFATELANGGNTDRRPVVDGRINPNFYTIRVGGRDFSVFGPTIGLLRAMGTLAVELSDDPLRPDKAMVAASRGLGGGVVRLVWDNLTGYGFRGDPAPIGIFRDEPDIISKEEQRGRVSSAGEILKYLGGLALPIAPSAVGGELIQGVQSAREGDWRRVGGAGLAMGAEAIGARASRLSRQDEAEELSKDRFGVPYESLTSQVQNEIDRLVTERMGEYAPGGPKESLYKKKDEYDANLVSASESLANEYLSKSPASGDYSPTLAREHMNAAKSDHRKKIHGDIWSEAKQRITGGLLESMYDRDQEKEDPKPGSREYRLWEYGQTFADATDPKTGELDFDTLNKLQSRFWASLGYRQDPELGRVSEVDEMLESIRLIEAEFDPRMQNLLDAGRYASSFTMSVANENIRYYDLDKHKAVLSYIVNLTGANPRMVERYIDMTYSERDAFEKTSQGDRIGIAFARAQRSNGILWKLRRHFVRNAPREWKQAMFEAGYQYMGKDEIEAKVFAMVKAGETLPKHNYKNMLRATLIGQ